MNTYENKYDVSNFFAHTRTDQQGNERNVYLKTRKTENLGYFSDLNLCGHEPNKGST